jgi:adenylate cyclase
MNRFLTPLTNAIIERNGTIDKYIGDAIMAFWNAPVDDSEQESNACDAALEMLSRAATLNGELKEEAQANGGQYMPLRVDIGLNTGPCVVGNMGSDFRFNYSVLGDTVNLASRLEARTKDYRVPIVIGSRTAEAAQRKFGVMEIDLILVKGKTQPEAVFAVLGHAEIEADARCAELRELNAQMLAHFRKQQWDDALQMNLRCRKLANGFDLSGLYDMYEERASPPIARIPPDRIGTACTKPKRSKANFAAPRCSAIQIVAGLGLGVSSGRRRPAPRGWPGRVRNHRRCRWLKDRQGAFGHD